MKNISYNLSIIELTKVVILTTPSIEDGYWKLNFNLEYSAGEFPKVSNNMEDANLPGILFRISGCNLVKSTSDANLVVKVKDGDVI